MDQPRVALYPEQVVGHLDDLVVGEMLERPAPIAVVHESLDERVTTVPTPCPASCLPGGELAAVAAARTDDRGVRAQTRRMRRRNALAVRIGATCRVRSQFIAIDHASTSSSCVALGKSAALAMKSATSAGQSASFRAGCQGGP